MGTFGDPLATGMKFLPIYFQIFWNSGCQLVSLNFQTPDLPMQLNQVTKTLWITQGVNSANVWYTIILKNLTKLRNDVKK